MSIIEGTFWKGVFPFLWISGTGTGIKIYMRDGYDLDIDFLNESKNILPPSPITFAKTLTSDGLKLVNKDTSDDILKSLLVQRLYPHHQKPFTYYDNQIFDGSKQFPLQGQEYKTTDGKKIFIVFENKKTEIEELKKECINALSKVDTSTKDQKVPQYFKLKEWCTEPKIKTVLERHKLKTLNTENKNDDEYWKEIIVGGWFKDSYKDKQSFISSSDLSSLSGISDKSNVQDSHINILKNKCKTVLDKSFTRNIFPAPKSFVDAASDKSKFKQVDEFQEAALFCTKPETAQEYVNKAMQGILRTSLPTGDKDWKDDFCLLSNKTLNDYKNTKTHEPFEGKSFWCAVRILYDRHKDTKKQK